MPIARHLVTYKSGLEDKTAAWLEARGIPVLYEQESISFEQPSKQRRYTPDFKLPNGIFIETKGLFSPADRHKHIWVKQQNPRLDIRFVFTNSKSKIYKGSKTTYAMWCTKNGFKYADKEIPTAWLK